MTAAVRSIPARKWIAKVTQPRRTLRGPGAAVLRDREFEYEYTDRARALAARFIVINDAEHRRTTPQWIIDLAESDL